MLDREDEVAARIGRDIDNKLVVSFGRIKSQRIALEVVVDAVGGLCRRARSKQLSRLGNGLVLKIIANELVADCDIFRLNIDGNIARNEAAVERCKLANALVGDSRNLGRSGREIPSFTERRGAFGFGRPGSTEWTRRTES